MIKLAKITSTYRARLIINTYRKLLKPKQKVLDIGCGNGVVSKIIQDEFRINLTGCDILDYLTETIRFKKMVTPDNLPFSKNSFDIGMFNDVLHHIPKQSQEKLILESLRVSRAVLIFEVQPTISGVFFDWLLNKIHNPAMNIPFTFRKQTEWEKLFKRLKIKYRTLPVNSPLIYPFTHKGFYLYN